MIPAQLWAAIAVEATRGVRAVVREALDDAGLASIGSVTSLTPAAAPPPGTDLLVDAALLDVQPVTYRSGSSPNDVHVIGVALTFLVSMEQDVHDVSDDLVIRAFGAIVGRFTERNVRLYVSPVLGGLAALVVERMPLSLGDQAALFAASGQPLRRAALYGVRVSRGIGEPDIPLPADIPPVVAWNGPRRFIVVRGGSAHVRRSVATAMAGEATIARVDAATVAGPWIDETEKNLATALAAASDAGAVLLFDEADALFARRTDISDAHDRYAAIIVTTSDDAVAKELAGLGAEVVDAGDGEPRR